MTDAFDYLKENDLTPDLQMLMDVCGIETVKELLRHLNGLSFYIPKISHLDTLVLRYMKHHPALNFKQVARELGVSEPFLKNISRRKM